MRVIDNILNSEELKIVSDFLAQASFTDGKITAGKLTQGKKNNLQLDSKQEGTELLDKVIIQALSRNHLFSSLARPRTFSAPLYARYEPGMKYGAHVDSPLMGIGGKPMRTDLSITIFLNDPSEYSGGELVIDADGQTHAVKLPAGSAFVYPTTLLHQVNEVTKGQREVVVLWVQSMIKDAHIRATLFDLQAATESLSESNEKPIEAQLLQKTFSNLQRYFMEC
jgi:PKHD-type hydroxylase